MANSFPKSGTHLLVQILEAFPGITNYDSFIASTPSIRLRERSRRTHLRRIGWIAPGELVSAHLFYDKEYHEHLRAKRCTIFFIYRDPRDVAVSEAHYLTYMNRWHRAHRYFARRLHSDDERIAAAITGIPRSCASYYFPDIARRFVRYRNWLDQDDVFAVRYEDLVGSERETTIARMVDFFARETGYAGDQGRVLDAALQSIEPKRSHTFRAGRAGGWRLAFTHRHKQLMKQVAGELLVELGYEQNLEW